MKMLQQELCSELLSGSLQLYGDHMAGEYKGYYIMIEPENGQYIVTVAAHLPEAENNDIVKNFLREQQREQEQITGCQTEKYMVRFSVQIEKKEKNISAVINSAVEPLIAYLSENHYISGCRNCGRPVSLANRHKVSDGYCYLCSECVSAGVLREDVPGDGQNSLFSNISQEKSSPVPGFFGALLGSLVGGALWILFFRIGIIAGIAGAAAAICAAWGYEKLGKCMDRKGMVITLLVTAFTIYLANRIAWAWDIFDLMQENGFGFMDIFAELDDFLAFSGSWQYYRTLLVGYVLTVICMFRTKRR
ncbi:hypothetical protein IMSAGC013_00682 [Lachnospiraceae bacterium]|nr:hypothetical protein IMSAGC013_00682 [Lachnospiraceae bacterium]